MHIHILGICGTFMGGLAILARARGDRVTGSDAQVYPPMSTQLQAQGIELMEGYQAEHLDPAPDLVVIGNALSRGNPAVEAVLNRGLPYCSGAEWLARHVLPEKWVLGVAGTHGKTTTASMLAWILEDAQMAPGFLIGGIPTNFGVSARMGESPFFVVEADEYDTAFFDKRSKFVHYRPRTLIINNLEFDHADIFPDLAAIQRQFHHLLRTVPGNGLVVMPHELPAVDEVIAQGCWTPIETFNDETGGSWHARALDAACEAFEVYCDGQLQGRVEWQSCGAHNMRNGLAAIAAARHAGVPTGIACEGLSRFEGAKRRLEVRGSVAGVTVYDDFAHHPTAIRETLSALRGRVGQGRIIAVLEPRSNTMRMGVHQAQLAPSLAEADEVVLYQPPGLDWGLDTVIAQLEGPGRLYTDLQALVQGVVANAGAGDQILVMSNGGFGGVHQRLLDALGDLTTQEQSA